MSLITEHFGTEIDSESCIPMIPNKIAAFVGLKVKSSKDYFLWLWQYHLQVYKADLVLLAMGFLGPERYIINELELEQDPRSNICTPPGKYATTVDKVFAAGGQLHCFHCSFYYFDY